MIKFRELKAEEFSDYKSIFIQDYSEDLAINHGYSVSESAAIATKSFTSSFPDGTPIENDKLVCILADSISRGYLWYSIDRSTGKAFIFDFFMFEQYRSHGYGKSALSALEAKLAEQNVNYLGLRVAYDNPRAQALYKSIGFKISGVNMSKRLLPKS